jgi:hypothetical protein
MRLTDKDITRLSIAATALIAGFAGMLELPGTFKAYSLILGIAGAMTLAFSIRKLPMLSQKSAPAPNPALDAPTLGIAEQNAGRLTPAILALRASITVEQAEAELQRLAARGICSPEVNDEGRIEYHFPDFLRS